MSSKTLQTDYLQEKCFFPLIFKQIQRFWAVLIVLKSSLSTAIGIGKKRFVLEHKRAPQTATALQWLRKE